MPFSSIHSKRVRSAVGGKTRRRKMSGRRRTKRRRTVGGRVLRNRGGGSVEKQQYNFIKEMFERYKKESNLLYAQFESDANLPETVNLICIKKDIYIYGTIDRYPAFGLCTRDEITENKKIVQVDFYKKSSLGILVKYTKSSKNVDFTNVDFTNSNFPLDQDQQNGSNADLQTQLNTITGQLAIITQFIEGIKPTTQNVPTQNVPTQNVP